MWNGQGREGGGFLNFGIHILPGETVMFAVNCWN